MKIKLLFSATFACCVFSFSSLAQIKIDNNGNIGLGTASPAYKVDIFGQTRIITTTPIYGNSATVIFNSYYSEINIETDRDNVGYLGYNKRWNTIYTRYINCPNPIITSDERMKTNIRQINTPLQTIKRLRGITFDYKAEEYFGTSYQPKSTSDEKETKNRLGFVAQEVQQVLPQIVVYDTAKKYYGINYVALIPVLVEAIKEQQLIIEGLQNEIKELKKSNSKLKSASLSAGMTNISSSSNTSEHMLYQNVPNPFSQSTTIEYYLADGFQHATLNIYDMNGTQLKSIALHQKGYGNVTLNGYELKAGIYVYALIVDGQLIDTKRMVLTE
ncbi:MAG: tail fiber domain-containing protein [Bacteroidales bacterium]|nr:tail fiber domain-containing protein [Bacteroidales bacterium]